MRCSSLGRRLVSTALSLAIVGNLPLMALKARAEEPQLAEIINGNTADEGEYPWMAAILYKYNGRATDEHGCGGTLIAPQYVLTAAHCALDAFGDPIDPSQVEVLLGQSRLSSQNGKRYALRGIVLHPKFDSFTLEYDFALLKLDAPAPYQTLEVAGPNEVTADRGGVEARIVGWGMTDPTRPVLPDVLQEATVPVVDDAICLERDGRWFLPEMMLCAGKLSSSANVVDGVDVCYGDSGGPLLTKLGDRWKQIGVTSWGLGGCADTKTNTIFARTRAAYGFIYSFPTIAPRVLSYPEIQGSPIVGKSIGVSTGVWGGDPVTEFSYAWQRVSSDEYGLVVLQEIEGATSPTYTVTESDVGFQLSASVTAKNAAESVVAYADYTSLVETLPTPEPSVEPTPSDTSAPNSRYLGAGCDSKSCNLYFSVQDDAGPGAVSTINATVRKRVPSPKGPKKTKLFTTQVSALQIGTDLWQITLRRQRSARYQVLFAAVDASGNVESPGLHLKLPNLSKLAAVK
jgi:trypsin